MTASITPVSYRLAHSDPGQFVRRFAGSFERYGFAVVSEHELPQELIDACLERLSNHALPSTTHRVVNPTGERMHLPRYSMPFFLHFNSDFPIATLPACITPDRPNRYPEPILADDYLREIKLIY